MTLKNFFVGSVVDESYGQGVRRRIKSAGVIWGLALVSLAVTYGAFALSGSVWMCWVVAMFCGFLASTADVRIDPLKDDTIAASDKRLWLFFFVPALLLLGMVSAYEALHADDGLGVVRAALVASLFGWVLGSTVVMTSHPVSRARVEGTTSTTSASSDR